MSHSADPPYAHSLPDKPPADWEPLPDHLSAVARLASVFAGAFGAADWGRLVGLWHDLGKLQPDFQRYIRGELSSGPPHAWVGAVFAAAHTGTQSTALPLAAAIAAHHGTLADVTADTANGIRAGHTLTDLIADRKPSFTALTPLLPRPGALPPLPAFVTETPADAAHVELFTRFLFSVLIDADRSATAAFYARHQLTLTPDDLHYDEISVLAARLDAAIDGLPARGSPAVIELRRRVLLACRTAADRPPGRFSLTVPTGGGKTLSAMSFALNHAVKHNLRRVIVVIPYTSIIEQSARVYRDILNTPQHNNVLEHHSNLDEQKLSEQDARGEDLRKLAAENWDAPVIVTTTVQLFESLLAANGSRCRKLHNIARSVLLLDEVQTLPPQYLDTITHLLNQLTAGYGCSVVLSTATPPALAAAPGSKHAGLVDVYEIMPNPSALAAAARRVTIDWRIVQPTPYAALAPELRTHRQVLAIVHRRDDAQMLAHAVGEDALHLSAAMCPAHRLAVITEVRRRLAAGRPCRLIATQLIEAGVDVDFPVVYRSLAGLDSIAQSAGRCDREGKLTDAAGAPAGRMVVFRAETDPPPGTLRKAFESMQVLLQLRPVDPFNPDDSLAFFNELYGKIGPDERRIQPLRRALAFATVADTFKLIDNDTHAVIVPYKNAEADIDGPARLAAYLARPTRQTRRALQPLIVQLRRYQLDALHEAGIVTPAAPDDPYNSFHRLCEGREENYSSQFGLHIPHDTTAPAEAFVI